ncbi:MAG: class I SAM-dependent methyltransferase, partial [Pseudomonas fluorescens]|nr:class I SAM-dependent methyltransferase [Pseudomonas fluorescens]
FSIGLSENAVECIFFMQMFQLLHNPEHRLEMLGEFYRVSRDTVIVAVRLDGLFKAARSGVEGPLPSKTEVESEFRQAGFRLLSHQDFFPGCARMRVYVLGKTS